MTFCFQAKQRINLNLCLELYTSISWILLGGGQILYDGFIFSRNQGFIKKLAPFSGIVNEDI
eukprot:snap_masked-scaffold_8-processed-gene-7.36-mRNA-1 protein AED:1.00 eAED:1.00 QI:0/0/0/0/1/1/3/0/61